MRLHFPVKRVLGLPWPKRSEVVANHSPSYTAEVKNEWSYTSNSSVCLRGVDRATLPFKGGLLRFFSGRIITVSEFGGCLCISLQGDRSLFGWMLHHLILMHCKNLEDRHWGKHPQLKPENS
jgi:hypothetical protein